MIVSSGYQSGSSISCGPAGLSPTTPLQHSKSPRPRLKSRPPARSVPIWSARSWLPLGYPDRPLLARIKLIRQTLIVWLVLTLGAFSAPLHQADGLPHAFEAGWKGTQVCELLYENTTVRVGRCVFPPGIGHEKHFHRPHFGYTLSTATMTITDADGTVVNEIQEGTTWSSDSLTVHEVVNTGTTTASYIIVEPIPQVANSK